MTKKLFAEQSNTDYPRPGRVADRSAADARAPRPQPRKFVFSDSK
jgi:hypothetical protein